MKLESRALPGLCRLVLTAGVVLLGVAAAPAQPHITSWLTNYSGRYARVYTNDANKLAGLSQTTWTNSTGSLVQALPAYAGIQEIATSTDWVYLRSSGLGSHIMGPWYLNAGHTTIFPNMPVNTEAWYRIPRTSTIPGGKTLTGLGAIGYFVDGVSMFDTRDGMSYTSGSGSPGTEANPGSTYWNRDAYVNEGVTFDPAFAHQPGGGQYHYHANPPALRHLLGDNVLFNNTTKAYSEDTNNASPAHSPILGWVRDGIPVYGPYGYSNALSAASGVRRMISGFQLRSAADSGVTSRTTYPLWAVRVKGLGTTNLTTDAGPTVSAGRPLGRYMEDNDYLGDLLNSATGSNYVQGREFDLNEWNARFCVTPEFPGGTWAYFVCLNSNGTPVFPYNIGRQFYGSPTGGNVTTLTETVVTNFVGGPNTPLTLQAPATSNYNVTLVWTSVEGGTYQVASSTDAVNFNPEIASVPSQGLATTANYTGVDGLQYGRVQRTTLAAYDPVGATATVSQSATQSFTITVSSTAGTNAIPPQTGTYGTAFNFTFANNAFTGLTNPVGYSASGMPPGIVFNNTTSNFNGTSTQVGSFIVTIVATDSGTPVVTLTNSFALTVNPAPLTVTADSFSRAVGEANPTFTAGYSGFVLGQTLGTSDVTGTPSLTTSATPGSPAGGYAITATNGTLASAHYAFSFVNGTLTVTNTGGTTNIAGSRNILLIIADDWGFDSSSLYNSTTGVSMPPTPNINALAERGVLFRNAYASPVCSPTRACILTGQYGFRTGIGDVVAGMTSPSITPANFTLPDAFAANPGAGYALAQFGKWHLGAGNNAPATRGGWTNYAGGLGGAVANYTNWIKAVNGVTNTVTTYATTDLVNDAVNWISARGTNKWFAWVAFNAPHTPFHTPPASLAPGYATNTGPISSNRRQYEAMVEAMDTEIGRLLASIDTNKTDIIFFGDNGTPGQVIQTPFVNGKAKDTLYEGGTRVPFFIAGPSVVNPGRTNVTLVHVVDVFSTILELAGIDVAATTGTNVIDSRSLYPAFQDQPLSTTYGYVEAFNYAAPTANDGRVLRNDRYKLIRFNVNGTEQLYDLQTDPTEITNLLASALSSVVQSNYNALTWRLGEYQNLITAPIITDVTNAYPQFKLTVARDTNANYTLWRAPTVTTDLAWAPVTNAIIVTNGTTSVTLTDPFSLLGEYYYRAMATAK